MGQLGTEVSNSVEQSKTHTMTTSQVRLQIEALANDLGKNTLNRDEIGKIVDIYNNPAETDIQVPFEFFFDLYREQHREVEKLATKVKEAENLADKLNHQFK